MKKILGLFLTLALLCTVSITTTGCKKTDAPALAPAEAEKKEDEKKVEAETPKTPEAEAPKAPEAEEKK